ncbi:flagellar biosynthesis protein FlhF [Wenzhouxiangella limi]|uniref:Flagellar biosynthesis protein FlhF n=1 Tax=Wenzhouxiangella limi TaxID=2707351 RepID=A0A845UU19_9GAMM|nr:flagellar biosynthesis protein FlhF [Wenzhouxiangella limi]NDY95323.1 flagellar biosynthesis protein FlhF [Wenzhouxiangella limi]
MKIKRYMAPDMRQALKMVRKEQGPDAVILSSRRVNGGLELIAAVDYDESLVEQAVRHGQDEAAAALTREPGRADSPSEGHGAPASERAEGRSPVDDLLEAEDAGAAASSQASPAPRPRPQGRRKPEIVWSQEPTLVSMRAEINALRRILEGQLSSLAWNDLARRSPARAAILRQLLHLGLAPELAQELANGLEGEADDFGVGWRQVLGELAQRLPVCETEPLDTGGVIALVGATGVGKTTTIAKLAARYAHQHGPESVALISADDYRVGAQEQLFTYGRMLNIPVYVATTAAQLTERIGRLSHARLILLDTAGVGARDARLERSLESLESAGRPLLPYLVLAANSQLPALDESVSAFSRLPLAGCVVTKLDEAASLGGLLSVLVRHRLPIAYSTDGQEVPEHLRRASARNLVRRAHELTKPEEDEMDDDVFAQQLGRSAEYAFG